MADYDTELMLRASRGEDAAFRELFDRNYKRAVNVVYRSIGDRDLAEDIAMDAFARIYESRSRFQPKARFTTYLYRVLVNLAINASKRARIVHAVSVEDHGEIVSPTDGPAEQTERGELARAVREAVLALPANQKLALILTRYENLSYQAAAEAMNLSVGALESLLHRAKVNLRKALGDYIFLE